MNGDDLFTGNGEEAVDQWTLDQTSGAATALQKHWVCTIFAADPSQYGLIHGFPNTT